MANIFTRFSDKELKETLGIYDDTKQEAEKGVRTVLEIRRLFQSRSQKENEVAIDGLADMLEEYANKNPFTFKGNDTDLSIYWQKGRKDVSFAEYEGLDDKLKQRVVDNFESCEQRGLVKINNVDKTIALTDNGADYIRQSDYILSVLRSDIEYNEAVCGAIRGELEQRGVSVDAFANNVDASLAEADEALKNVEASLNAYEGEDYAGAVKAAQEACGYDKDKWRGVRALAEQASGGQSPLQTVANTYKETEWALTTSIDNTKSSFDDFRGNVALLRKKIGDGRGALKENFEINFEDGVLSTQGEIVGEALKDGAGEVATESATTTVVTASAEAGASSTGVGAVAVAAYEAAKVGVEVAEKELALWTN